MTYWLEHIGLLFGTSHSIASLDPLVFLNVQSPKISQSVANELILSPSLLYSEATPKVLVKNKQTLHLVLSLHLNLT